MILQFLWRHLAKLALLASSVWGGFGLVYWGRVDGTVVLVLLILAVWVAATLLLPRRAAHTQRGTK